MNSVVNQTLKDIEIIVINDCSTDDSERVVLEFANNDKRIVYKALEQNSGQGFVRNIGIEQAKGEYVFFLDSDDYLDLQGLEILYDIALKQTVEILQASYTSKMDYNESTSYLSRDFDIKVYESGLHYMESQNSVSILVWDKLWKRDFLIRNNLKFKARKWEDITFVTETFMHAKRIATVDFCFYRYNIRENSTTTSKPGKKHLEDALELIQDQRELYLLSKGKQGSEQALKIFIYTFAGFFKIWYKYDEDHKYKYEIKEKVLAQYKKERKLIFKAEKLGIVQKVLFLISPNFAARVITFLNK